MKTAILALSAALAGASVPAARANEEAVEIRQDINRLFFGGEEGNQRFVSEGATCEVIVRNDPEARVTEISVGKDGEEKTFRIAEDDAEMRRNPTHDGERGLIAVSGDAGPISPKILLIEKEFVRRQLVYRVGIIYHYGDDIRCDVY